MTTTLRDALLGQLDIAWALTEYHLGSLSTEECLWRPAARGLHVHDVDGVWKADWPASEGYDIGPASIAWLTWHLVFWWSMALDHATGAGTLTREAVAWPGSADAVRARVRELHDAWRALVASLDDEALASTARTKWPIEGKAFVDVVAWANVELMKNAAEIGYARFVYGAR